MDAPQTYRFAGDERFPNSCLSVVVYLDALPSDPAVMEQAFARQAWTNSWRNGIFRYHHFHTTAHEVLGIAAGRVRVLLGGPDGAEVAVKAGDVLVIPAGVAHCNLGDEGLLVVGAYPGGAGCDVLRGDPAQLAAAKKTIAQLPIPELDPVPGQTFLRQIWSAHAG